MYDFTQCLSDAIEVTHSICTLEFEDSDPCTIGLENVGTSNRPKQIEFARQIIIQHEQKTLSLVEEGSVNGWDDPRLQTSKGCEEEAPPKASKIFVS